MAIAFVGRVGQNLAVAAGTTLAVTVGVGGVAQGTKVIVVYEDNDNGTGNPPTCVDSKGNAYTLDADVQMSPNGNKRISFFSALLTVALVNLDTITVTCQNSNARRLMDVLNASGLGTAKDRVTSRIVSTNATPSTNPTEQRRFANEFLVAACAWAVNPPGPETWTAGAGFLAANLVAAEAATTNNYLGTEYQIMSAVGTEAGTGTLFAARGWIMVMVGYCEAGVSFGQQPTTTVAEFADIVGLT